MFSEKKFKNAIKDWFSNKCESLRYEYDLAGGSRLIDLGAYEGSWSEKMIKRYPKSVSYLYEPCSQYYEDLVNKFGSDERFNIYNYGLGGSEFSGYLSSKKDAASMFDAEEKSDNKCVIKKFEDHVDGEYDILKINIEGGEYELLENIDNLERFKNIQVQFHWFYEIDNFYKRWEAIREKLSKSHEPTYDYYFVWENWRLK